MMSRKLTWQNHWLVFVPVGAAYLAICGILIIITFSELRRTLEGVELDLSASAATLADVNELMASGPAESPGKSRRAAIILRVLLAYPSANIWIKTNDKVIAGDAVQGDLSNFIVAEERRGATVVYAIMPIADALNKWRRSVWQNGGLLALAGGLLLALTSQLSHALKKQEISKNKFEEERDFASALIDSLPGIFVLTDERGHLVRWNAEFLALTGGSQETLKGADAFANVIESDREIARARMREVFTRGPASVEFGIRNKAGDLRTVRFTARTITREKDPYLLGLGNDVTEARRAELELQFAHSLLRTAMENSPDGILVVDANAKILSVNQQFSEMWSISPLDIAAGFDAPILQSVAAQNQDPETFMARVRYLYEHPSERSDEELVTNDNRVIERHSAPLTSTAGLHLGRAWFFRDITERKRAQEKIRLMARHDSLTGLPNRAVFVEALDQAIARSNRSGKGFAVLYLDLDRFKDINDTLGHPIGDLLLQGVAQRLREAMRELDTVARFGGDEFAVIDGEIRDPADAAMLAERVVKALAEPFLINGNEIRSGSSVGISVYGPESPDAEKLLAHADVALYRAKAEGRGNYRFFTEAMQTDVRSRVTLGSELRAAITSADLVLVYQPQVDVYTSKIVGLEASVRWNHPTRGWMSAEEFVPIAENSGLIVSLGNWVIQETCRQAREWLDAGIIAPQISLSLSGQQFKKKLELEASIARVLEATRIAPQCLDLQLTEAVLMAVSRDHNDVLLRLRKAGMQLTITDFGNGYSSLERLRRHPVDRIKIARNFVLAMTMEPSNAAVVRAAIGLGREMKIDVVVEGVETADQLALVKAWGCRTVQGGYYSNAVSASEVAVLLRAGTIPRTPPDVTQLRKSA